MNVCFFFKQKTAYEMRISDWSSDVCSSDLARATAIQVNAEDLSDPVKMQQFAAAQGQLGGTLSRLLATVEAYPEVKSQTNFTTLMSQLEGTENRIDRKSTRLNSSH